MEFTDYETQRVITSWLQVGAVVVAAASLIISMTKNRIQSKLKMTTVVHEGLVKFIELSARHPHLYLMEPENRPGQEMSLEDREIERSAYLLLLLTYERMYQYASATGQRGRMTEFDRLISAYAPFPQFRDAGALVSSISGQDFGLHLEALLGPSSDSGVGS